jgi:hypothetical protein
VIGLTLARNRLHAMQKRRNCSCEKKLSPRAAAAGNICGVGDKEPARPNNKDNDMTQNKRSSAIMARLQRVTCCYCRILSFRVAKLG